jgi:hypothetical protein
MMNRHLTAERLASLRQSDDFGGGSTLRAGVVRELIDEVVDLRRQLADLLGDEDDNRPEIRHETLARGAWHPSSG